MDEEETLEVVLLDNLQEYMEVQCWDFERKSEQHVWFEHEGKWGKRSFDVVGKRSKERFEITCTMPMKVASHSAVRSLSKLKNLFPMIHEESRSLGRFTCTKPDEGRVLLEWFYAVPFGLINEADDLQHLVLLALAEVDEYYYQLRTALTDECKDAEEAFNEQSPDTVGRA